MPSRANKAGVAFRTLQYIIACAGIYESMEKRAVAMKLLNIAAMALMILFAVVQYNDPDGLLWVAIYMVPAVWAGLAAFKLDRVSHGRPFHLLVACFVAQCAVMVYYWPTTPGFWRQDVWWSTETAREGMGAMVAVIAIAVALASVWRNRRIHRA